MDPVHMAPLLEMLRGNATFVLGHTEELARAIEAPLIIGRGADGAIVGVAPTAPPAQETAREILELIAPTVTGSTRAYECICGSSITNTQTSITAHNKTTKHRKYIAGLQPGAN